MANPAFMNQVKGLLTEHMTGAKGGSCPTCGGAMPEAEPVRGSGRRKVGLNRGNSILSPDDEEQLGG